MLPKESRRPAPSAAASSSEAERVEALTKLKGLFDSGVLTKEQYEAERRKLLRRT
jgi:hypothetical protein